jgi:hypothetical protein
MTAFAIKLSKMPASVSSAERANCACSSRKLSTHGDLICVSRFGLIFKARGVDAQVIE